MPLPADALLLFGINGSVGAIGVGTGMGPGTGPGNCPALLTRNEFFVGDDSFCKCC